MLGHGVLQRILEGDLALATAQLVDDRVARDAVEPGEERLTWLVPWHRFQRSHEHVAREILRFGVVANSVVDVPVDRIDVPVVQESERRHVATRGSNGERRVLVLSYRRNGRLPDLVRSHFHLSP